MSSLWCACEDVSQKVKRQNVSFKIFKKTLNKQTLNMRERKDKRRKFFLLHKKEEEKKHCVSGGLSRLPLVCACVCVCVCVRACESGPRSFFSLKKASSSRRSVETSS